MDKNSGINDLFSSPIFLSAIFSIFIAQLIKALISIIRRKSSNPKSAYSAMLWSTGGMPSSHSAAVTALATSVAFEEGLSSPLFVSLTIYAMIVIRDALGVRRSTGLQAKRINEIGEVLDEKYSLKYEKIKEVHGHNPAEVSVGVILGFFIAVAFCNL